MKKVLIFWGFILLVVLIALGAIMFSMYGKYNALKSIKLDPHATLFYNGGGNSIMLSSADNTKAILVDPKSGNAARELQKRCLAKNIIIINTHSHFDHTGGNAQFPSAQIIAGAYDTFIWNKETNGCRYPDQPISAGKEIVIPFEDEIIHVRNLGVGHTFNDVVVYLEKRKLLLAGDLVFNNIHPCMFKRSGCSTSFWMQALDTLNACYPDARVLPGHGEMAGRDAITSQREYFFSITNAMNDEKQLGELKKKYKGRFAIPAMSSFEKTVDFIRDEQKR